jgi:probable HAF family extracellular repeat protein
MRIPLTHCFGTAAFVVASVLTLPAYAARYFIFDLGPDTRITPMDLNDRGEVSGYNSVRGPVVLRQGHWRSLPPTGRPTSASAMNDRGDVAGTFVGSIPGFWPRGGDFTPVPLPPKATRGGVAVDISNRQVIVGNYFVQGYQEYGCFRWSAAEGSVDLGFMADGNSCRATAINDTGQIVGCVNTQEGGINHAFLYEEGRFRDLGTLDGGDTCATDVNRQGHVVGMGSYSSFLWKDDHMIDLRAGTPYASVHAHAINDRDEIVAIADDAAGNHAVLFRGGNVTELATEVEDLDDWILGNPFLINNLGVIVGSGGRTDGTHYFMLVPIP